MPTKHQFVVQGLIAVQGLVCCSLCLTSLIADTNGASVSRLHFRSKK